MTPWFKRGKHDKVLIDPAQIVEPGSDLMPEEDASVILKRFGVSEKEKHLIKTRRKVSAYRAFQQRTRAGLRDAKVALDLYEQELD